MTPSLALAGIGGLSAYDELWFDLFVLAAGLIKAALMPIFTWDHPPAWMIWIQPVVVLAALLIARQKMAQAERSWLKRSGIYLVIYCVATFTTNMAGEARGVFRVAKDVADKSILILRGHGYPADTRP